MEKLENYQISDKVYKENHIIERGVDYEKRSIFINIDCKADYSNDDKVVVTCKYEYRYVMVPDSCRFSGYNCISISDEWEEKTLTEEFIDLK